MAGALDINLNQQVQLNCRAVAPDAGWCCAVAAPPLAIGWSFSVRVRNWTRYLLLAGAMLRTITVSALRSGVRIVRRVVRHCRSMVLKPTAIVGRIGPLRL